jgi:co-chaperonin GroES (HSP10)
MRIKSPLRPVRDYVVVVPEKKPDTFGGIIMPDAEEGDWLHNKTGGWCTVVAIGPKCEQVKKGDRVHLSAYGKEFANSAIINKTENGKNLQFIVIREEHINGVFTG